MRYKLSAIGFNWQLIFWVWQRFVVPRPVGVCRGGCQQPKMGERRSKEVLRKNWLVAKTNQAKKNPPTSLWKFGLALAVENYPQSHSPLGWCSATNRKWNYPQSHLSDSS